MNVDRSHVHALGNDGQWKLFVLAAASKRCFVQRARKRHLVRFKIWKVISDVPCVEHIQIKIVPA